MESYTFELKGNVFGFFQRNGEDCFLYINTGLFPKVTYYQWSHWQRGKDNYNETYPDAIKTDEIAKAIGYFSWNQCFDRCPYQPIVISLSKKIEAGIFYPRMNRGEPKLYNQQIAEARILDEVRSFNNICDSLNELFNYIDPDTGNLSCFGNKIREILIIACTEVEYLLHNFLTDNGYTVNNNRFSTNDYVKSLGLLKLDGYSTRLVYYPYLQEWCPFSGWDESKPTTSLTWYDAYNAVKHNRGTNKQKASLNAVINAVAAIHILLVAQYGSEIFNSPMHSNFSSIFNTTKYPSFLANDLQCPTMNHDQILWDKKSYLFS